MSQLREMGGAIWYSFIDALSALMRFLPALLGAIIGLIIGWLIAAALANLVVRGLRAVGLERAAERSGIGRFIERWAPQWTVSSVLAALIEWAIFLVFVRAAATALGLTQSAAIINHIILFIPNLIVALAFIVIGALSARFLARLAHGSFAEMGVSNPGLFAKLTQCAIIGFALVAALNHLGLAQTVVNTLLIGLVGTIALALGLSFGLGGREVAAQITRQWYENGRGLANRAGQRSDRFEPGDVSPSDYAPRQFEPGLGD